jgi:hypothetical protein
MLQAKLDEKTKIERYRFNDIKIDLSKLNLNDAIIKKNQVVRLEVALRDDYGIVYDTFYKTFTDGKFSFKQTFESFVRGIDSNEIKLSGEGFFVRIPTKSIETLKRLYLIFMVQFLVPNKEGKAPKIKASNFMNDMS